MLKYNLCKHSVRAEKSSEIESECLTKQLRPVLPSNEMMKLGTISIYNRLVPMPNYQQGKQIILKRGGRRSVAPVFRLE